jgi:hypothetical protein
VPEPLQPHRNAELVALAGGLLLGAVTAVGQQLLPDALRSLANSAGPWCLVAFMFAWRAPTIYRAAATGGLSLVALVGGYFLASQARGYASSMSFLLFWGAAAITVGPALGVAASWVRTGVGTRAAVGSGAVAGVLVGEAVYGLTVVSQTTSAVYWIAEASAGLVLLVFLGVRGRWGLRRTATAVAATAIVAGVLLIAYTHISP